MAARDLIRVIYPFCNTAVGIKHERNDSLLIVRTGDELDSLIDQLTELRERIRHEQDKSVDAGTGSTPPSDAR